MSYTSAEDAVSIFKALSTECRWSFVSYKADPLIWREAALLGFFQWFYHLEILLIKNNVSLGRTVLVQSYFSPGTFHSKRIETDLIRFFFKLLRYDVNVLDCDIMFYFRKRMKLLILPAMGKIVSLLFFYKGGFGIE